MIHKLSIHSDVIGTLEWTPPDHLQKKLDTAPTQAHLEVIEKWIETMMTGYVTGLLGAQRTMQGMTCLENWMSRLLSEVIMGDAATEPDAQSLYRPS